MASELDPQFVRHDSYARHRPIRSRALRSDSKNSECSSPTDANGEICSLQSCGSANAAKESWGDAPELCCAEGAVSLLAWGTAPGLVKSESPALKARFTFWASLMHDWRHAPVTQ